MIASIHIADWLVIALQLQMIPWSAFWSQNTWQKGYIMLWFDKQHMTVHHDVVFGDKQPWSVIKLKFINNMILYKLTHPQPPYGSVLK